MARQRDARVGSTSEREDGYQGDLFSFFLPLGHVFPENDRDMDHGSFVSSVLSAGSRFYSGRRDYFTGHLPIFASSAAISGSAVKM
ncbi:hypothetical protein, partial [Pinisolibacter sp.]|uniref:hypothetical protein n=1 Tax=Pinisolibacter sp. TaxID=2172024 RepID=UPI002FDD846E